MRRPADTDFPKGLYMISDLIGENAEALLDDWLEAADRVSRARPELAHERRLQARSFIEQLGQSIDDDTRPEDVRSAPWSGVRETLDAIVDTHLDEGKAPADIAFFVMSIKRPLHRLLVMRGGEPDDMLRVIWRVDLIVDRLGLYTAEIQIRRKEQVIARQQEEILELSSPVVQVWDGVLAVPLIGTLDSYRTQQVTETILEAVVETRSEQVILDITGVPTVDTQVAHHLLKTVAALRLMGAEAIVSGIRPQIAQTMVHLGVDLGQVVTKARLSDALKLAFRRGGLLVSGGAAN